MKGSGWHLDSEPEEQEAEAHHGLHQASNSAAASLYLVLEI